MGKKISEIIMDAYDDAIYVADAETYELLYLNSAARAMVGAIDEPGYGGKRCYEVLQGFDAPCPFCTNNNLNTEQFYIWEYFNESIGRHFILKDKLVEYEGKLVRLEIATDITQQENRHQKVVNRLSVYETLLNCIDTLKNNQDVDCAINSLLKYVGNFYQADRAHIFELDCDKQMAFNTYEWHSDEDFLWNEKCQKMYFTLKERWSPPFEKDGYIYMDSLEETPLLNSEESRILKECGISSLIAVPLVDNNNITVGFIGVDNPKDNLESVQLLCAISNFVLDDLHKRAVLAKLQQLSFEDTLTGVRNRNCYIQRLQELEKYPPAQLGVIYLDVNGLKEANDLYGHDYGDTMIKRTAHKLMEVYGMHVYRVGGDEFVVLCPDMKEKKFHELAEEFRRKMREEEFTVSMGLHWIDDGTSVAKQIARADEQMYMEKRNYHRMASRAAFASRTEK